MPDDKIGVRGGRASLGAPALGVNPPNPKPEDQDSNPKKVEHDGNDEQQSDDKDQDQQNDQDAS